jgi:hypothetical protein
VRPPQALRNGTTLGAALASYSQLERSFRKDSIEGAFYAWQRLGLDPKAVIMELFPRLEAATPQPRPPSSARSRRHLERKV